MASEQEAAVLSRWERIWFAVMSNRKAIGLWMFGLSALIRTSLWIANAEHTADIVKFASDVMMLTGSTTAITGASHADEHYQVKKEQTVSERSGEVPAFPGGKNEP